MSVTLFGNFTRRLFQVWSERAESANKLSSDDLFFTFYDMNIFPSSSQVHEMLQCASECSKRQNVDYLTFGEFCVFASELKTSYEHKVPRPTPLSKSSKECRRLSHRRKSVMPSKSGSKYEVFLGGSCNPTTWRTDVAIPLLKSSGVSYYNPQVSQWGPELMELENQAKQNAEVMFFVIDNQTRSVASMIEASHIAGTQRKLILIVNEFEKPGSIVMGEKITEKEFMDLQQGQRYLQDIVERQGIPVFRNIPQALNCAVAVLRENIRPQDLALHHDATHPVKMAYLHIGEKLIKLREVFDSMDSTSSGKISLKDVCMAFKIITCTELPIDNLKAVVAKQKGFVFDNSEMENVNLDDLYVDFNHFCCIMAEFGYQAENASHQMDSLKTKASHLLCSVFNPLTRLVDWVRSENGNCVQSKNSSDISFSAECRDIYLGGTPKPSTWREDIAIPLLKKKGLTCFTPQDGVWSERLIPLEAKNMENSQVLLFVITKDSRSLAQMVVAAHYVGLGCSVVLCIQYIEDETEINGEKLSSQAVKDYNRGRVYLSDLATRAHVPVFEKIDEAVECAMNLCLQNSS